LTVPCSLLTETAPKLFIRWLLATRKAACCPVRIAPHKKKAVGRLPGSHSQRASKTNHKATNAQLLYHDSPVAAIPWLAPQRRRSAKIAN
jgi:hypothetical protein